MPRPWLLAAVVLAGLAAAAPARPAAERVGLLSLEAPAGYERTLGVLAVRARTILPAVESDLGARAASRFRMILLPPGVPRDSGLARLDQAAPPWAAGYYLPALRVGAIRIAEANRYPYGTLESVLAHETAHVILHDAAGDRLPRWFDEGVATLQGRRWTLEDVLVYSSSLLTNDLPPLDSLDASFQASAGEARLAYAASFAFVAWNVRRHGPGWIPALLRATRDAPFPEAWAAVTGGGTLAQAERSWRRGSLFRYRWIPVLTASSTLWLVVALLALAGGVRRRGRARAERARWPEFEAVAPPDEPEAP